MANNNLLFGLDVSVIKSYRFSYLFSKLAVITLILFQLMYSLSSMLERAEYNKEVNRVIRERVALDLPVIKSRLPLSTEQDGHQPQYLFDLNEKLKTQGVETSVLIISSTDEEIEFKGLRYKRLLLSTVDQIYVVGLKPLQVSWWHYVSAWPLIAALLFSFVVSYHTLINRKLSVLVAPNDVDPCILKIDLKQKILINPITGSSVQLANKPLCFYSGLIEYCIKVPNASLNPNKELPEELDQFARKYFKRLIELGHTIRKRPSFTNNLEKALSEIRAALDELYGEDIATKTFVYPKKAIGEGSRSKAHSFALNEIEKDMVEVIGR